AAASAWEARSGDPDPAVQARFAAEYALALGSAGRPDEARRLLAGDASLIRLIESGVTQQEGSETLAAQPPPPHPRPAPARSRGQSSSPPAILGASQRAQPRQGFEPAESLIASYAGVAAP